MQLHQDNEARESFERLQTDLHQLINVEQTIVDIPAFVSVGGPFCLGTRNLKLALLAEATAWKAEHAAALHRAATEELSRNCDVVQELRQQMDSDIDSLDDLRVMIEVLESVDQHSQDLDVSSLERVFEVLREIGLTLPRQEVHALQELKQQCADITATAQRVRQELTTTRRPEFERLLDTQAKALMVATIHLRNSFDNSGPTIEGITPQEALMRLRRLSSLHRQLEEERQTLAAVEALLGFPPTPYPELDRTQRDLHRLEMLYGLYERFVAAAGVSRDKVERGQAPGHGGAAQGVLLLACIAAGAAQEVAGVSRNEAHRLVTAQGDAFAAFTGAAFHPRSPLA